MDWKIIVPAVLATFVAVAGWVIGHRLNANRDLKNNQRELRIKYLTEAYDTFVELGRNVDILGNYREVEKAIYNIHLFGTEHQISLCKKFVVEITKMGKADQTELVINIRDFIRKELGLKKVDKEITFLKITPKKQIK